MRPDLAATTLRKSVSDAARRLPVLSNERADVCGPCGGECCKSGPGIFHPNDFADLPRDLRLAIDSGRICLDWWEGFFDGAPGPVYFVRPAVVGHEGRALHPAWDGACANLTPSGCVLPFAKRPWQCRALVPKSNGKPCHYPGKPSHEGNKEMGVRAWLPHQGLLGMLARFYRRSAP